MIVVRRFHCSTSVIKSCLWSMVDDVRSRAAALTDGILIAGSGGKFKASLVCSKCAMHHGDDRYDNDDDAFNRRTSSMLY